MKITNKFLLTEDSLKQSRISNERTGIGPYSPPNANSSFDCEDSADNNGGIVDILSVREAGLAVTQRSGPRGVSSSLDALRSSIS